MRGAHWDADNHANPGKAGQVSYICFVFSNEMSSLLFFCICILFFRRIPHPQRKDTNNRGRPDHPSSSAVVRGDHQCPHRQVLYMSLCMMLCVPFRSLSLFWWSFSSRCGEPFEMQIIITNPGKAGQVSYICFFMRWDEQSSIFLYMYFILPQNPRMSPDTHGVLI